MEVHRHNKHRGKHRGIKHRLQSRLHGSSLPSILLANVQASDCKLGGLCARISFQRDIRNCNVLWFTETWLNPGIPDSAIQAGGEHCVPGYGHQPAGCGELGNDAVLLRHPLLAGAGKAGEVRQQQFFTIMQLIRTHGQAENFGYRLELNVHRRCLT